MKKVIIPTILYCLFFLTNCSTQEKKWKETTKINTILAYHAYDSLFPANPHQSEALSKIDTIRKSFRVKCLVVIRNGKKDPRDGNINYLGTVQHQQVGWYDIKSPVRPTIYLWRDLPLFGDVIFKDTRDEKKIKTNIIYLEKLGYEDIYFPVETMSTMTDEDIAKLYNIDFIDKSGTEANNSPVYTVRVNGDKWTEKGIYNNNK